MPFGRWGGLMGNDMSDDNFGPWIDWAGGPCPIPDAKAGEYELRFADSFATDVTTRHDAAAWEWANTGEGGAYGAGNIIAYRVRLPADDLLRQAIEALRNLNELNENYAPFGGEIFQDRVERAWGSARAVLTAYDKRGA